MEVQELVFYYLHENTNTVEVQFRMVNDSEDVLRSDIVDINGAEDFGYNILTEDLFSDDEFSDDEDEFDFLFDDSMIIDEDILLDYLNEYYLLNPEKLPKPELI
jgi:hypothetical protein